MVHRQWYVGIGAYTSRLVWAEQKKMILFFYITVNPKHTNHIYFLDIFILFLWKIKFDISCESSHMKYQDLFGSFKQGQKLKMPAANFVWIFKG